jgi:hypothetical protein
MHPYQLQIEQFFLTRGKELDHILLEEMAISIRNDVRRHLSEERESGDFRLRMSNIGRPLCQLQMEQAETPRLPNDYNFAPKMAMGSMTEALAVLVMKHAGIPVTDEQKRVALKITVDDREVTINGSLDVVIDGAVWDVKSTSEQGFKKFNDYSTLKREDTFGYIQQLFGYAYAAGLKPGGWIVVEKTSQKWKFLPVPDDWKQEQEEAMRSIWNTAKAILTREPFRRCFEEQDEFFRKKPTGNKYISSPCSYCEYRNSCWPTLEYARNPASSAKTPTYKYYTHLSEESRKKLNETSVGQSEGATTSTDGGEEDS